MPDWRTRLTRLYSDKTPSGRSRIDAEKYLNGTVVPALQEIAEVVSEQDGREARVSITGHSATIVIIYKAREEFYYGVQLRAYHPPHEGNNGGAVPYYRAEIILSKGSIGYDVMKYDKMQLIRHFLLEYDKRLKFKKRKQVKST